MRAPSAEHLLAAPSLGGLQEGAGDQGQKLGDLGPQDERVTGP